MRRPAKVPVAVRYGRRGWSCETVDVSRRGVFLACPTPRPPSSRVCLGIGLPNGSIRAEGVVARAVAGSLAEALGVPSGMGVYLDGFDLLSRWLWDEFVDGLRIPADRDVDGSPSQVGASLVILEDEQWTHPLEVPLPVRPPGRELPGETEIWDGEADESWRG